MSGLEDVVEVEMVGGGSGVGSREFDSSRRVLNLRYRMFLVIDVSEKTRLCDGEARGCEYSSTLSRTAFVISSREVYGAQTLKMALRGQSVSERCCRS